MHPICEAPDCMAESKARVNVFLEGFGGGLYVNLCTAHAFGLVNCWPLIMDGLVGKTSGST